MSWFKPTTKQITIDCFRLELDVKLSESKAKTIVHLEKNGHLLDLKNTFTKQPCKMI